MVVVYRVTAFFNFDDIPSGSTNPSNPEGGDKTDSVCPAGKVIRRFEGNEWSPNPACHNSFASFGFEMLLINRDQ
jgi:hypothetical protein